MAGFDLSANTVLTAIFSTTHGGSATLEHDPVVAAVPGKSIVVLAATLSSSVGSETLLFASGAANAPITAYLQNGVSATVVLPFSEIGWCATGKGEVLSLGSNAANGLVSCMVKYILV